MGRSGSLIDKKKEEMEAELIIRAICGYLYSALMTRIWFTG